MKPQTNPPKPKLDWSRLLGFDQAERGSDSAAVPELNDPRLAKLGAKFGGKPGHSNRGAK